VINYNIDDPFGTRDLRTWRLYLASVPYYDALFVMRNENVREAQALSAKAVYRVWMSADEVAHAPLDLSSEERLAWASDVVFVGTWMPERGPFLARLLELGVPLAIFGNRWSKAPEWAKLRPAVKGAWLDSSASYRKAILGAKVCLGLLSKGNRDQSTTRSFEIPFAGRALCAERTAEHLSLYVEGQEAEFWNTPEECAEKCRMLLADDRRREEMAERGRQRCIRNGTLNERILEGMLKLVEDEVGKTHQAHALCR
jgi:spore maturation protein CgeB